MLLKQKTSEWLEEACVKGRARVDGLNKVIGAGSIVSKYIRSGNSLGIVSAALV
jgi:hypothetical protein